MTMIDRCGGAELTNKELLYQGLAIKYFKMQVETKSLSLEDKSSISVLKPW